MDGGGPFDFVAAHVHMPSVHAGWITYMFSRDAGDIAGRAVDSDHLPRPRLLRSDNSTDVC